MSEVVNTPIHKWAIDDRPREKLVGKGPTALSDAELVAILLSSGNRNESAVQLAQRILRDHGNDLNRLGKVSIRNLQKNYKGVGQAKAVAIAAALELGRRRKQAETFQKQIASAEAVFDLLHPYFSDLHHEELWVLLLNKGHALIDKHRLSMGGLDGTVADLRVMFRHALEASATSLILVHNHPSGRLYPSQADIDLTQRAKDSGKLLTIPLLDHIIIGNSGFYSFADAGML